MVVEKLDPHKHEHFYTSWKDKGMPLQGMSEPNKEILIEYLEDMEIGQNVSVSSKKGARSYGRLRNLKGKLHALLRLIEKHTGKKDITKVTENDLMRFFNSMRKGEIKSLRTNMAYSCTGTYVKAFKAFWHWHMKASKKKGLQVPDITSDLDTRDDKPKFNYFTLDQLQTLCDNSKIYYKTLMLFLFDSGIRAPTELMNTKVSDLEWADKNDCYHLNIRDEVSKTFGRRIKLLLSSNTLKKYIKQNNLKKNDFLFTKSPKVVNQYLREIGFKLLQIGEKTEQRHRNYTGWIKDGLTLYDFRHSSACYWLVRYKNESALKYRFGWKKSEMIHYYTELLGMKDTITEDDLIDVDMKNELQKQLEKERQQRNIMQEQLTNIESQSKAVRNLLSALLQNPKTRNSLGEMLEDKKLRKMIEQM